MATIKSYTDINQSKKLAEVLPLESADMCYHFPDIQIHNYALGVPWEKVHPTEKENSLPCWSLAALLDILPSATLDSSNDHYYRLHCMERYTEWYNNPIDACYEMILKLNELNLL